MFRDYGCLVQTTYLKLIALILCEIGLDKFICGTMVTFRINLVLDGQKKNKNLVPCIIMLFLSVLLCFDCLRKVVDLVWFYIFLFIL